MDSAERIRRYKRIASGIGDVFVDELMADIEFLERENSLLKKELDEVPVEFEDE